MNEDRIFVVKLLAGMLLFGLAVDFGFLIFSMVHAHFETSRLAASMISSG